MLELLPTTPHNIDDMCDELVKLLDTIDHMPLRYLLEAYLHDDALMEKFRTAPAAMTLHHAYLGGLLEHTLALVKVADAVCPLYPQVNRDIVLMGAFLHDLGKCIELKWTTGFGYTDQGQLVGHIAQGALMLQQKVIECRERDHKIPDDLVMVLQHIILSHHGKPEFGAVKLPATPEALLLSMLDNLDAKMHMAISATREGAKANNELGGNFTEKIWALETRLYRPDVAAVPQPQPEVPAEEVAAAPGAPASTATNDATSQRPL
jgi:3'-5' exoribonuclease